MHIRIVGNTVSAYNDWSLISDRNGHGFSEASHAFVRRQSHACISTEFQDDAAPMLIHCAAERCSEALIRITSYIAVTGEIWHSFESADPLLTSRDGEPLSMVTRGPSM